MNPTLIALLVAWPGPGYGVEPTFLQSSKPGSTAEREAGLERTNENGAADDQKLILELLREVEAAFSDSDLPRWLSLFHSPFLIMAPEGVAAPSSRQEALALLRPQMENLRARGYVRSELSRATAKLLSATTALAAVEWIRRKANDEELQRLGATYALFKGPEGWRIVMVTVHPPASLPELK